MKTNEIELHNYELIGERHEEGPISDMGQPYLVTVRLYRIDGELFEDYIQDGPWQVGGNGGQVRELRPL